MKTELYNLAKKIFYGAYNLAPGPCLSFQDYWQKRRMRKACPTLKKGLLIPEQKAVLVDVSDTSRTDINTGIQRVVKKLLQELTKKRPEGIVPVCACGDILSTSNGFAEGEIKEEQQIRAEDAKRLLLLDLSLNCFPYYKRLLKACHRDIEAAMVVYDLFPIQYSELFPGRLFSDKFTQWIKLSLQYCTSVICISKTVADNVVDYYCSLNIKRSKPLKLYYFHMGADIVRHAGPVREELKQFVAEGEHTFLMVGTVEPRKGHKTVLEALERLQSKKDVRLLLLGRNGWKNDAVLEIMQRMQKQGKKVLWLQDASDAEVSWAYQNTSALIAASKDEGFGLPLIEAAYYGLPILCSDIPIFREVTEGNATYFQAMDEQALSETMKRWLEEERHPDSGEIRIYSWADSAAELWQILDGKAEPYAVMN